MFLPKWTATLFFSGLLCLASPALPAAEGERLLSFPEESVGVVTISNLPIRDGHLVTFAPDVRDVMQAQGRIAVPDDCFIGLELSEKTSGDLSFLLQLPTDVLGALRVNGAHVGNEEMRQVVRLKSVAKLEFSQCDFSADAFDELEAMPELLHLEIWHRGNRDEQGRGIAGWIGKQPKLQTFCGEPHLSSADLRAIGAHPTLTATSVDLGKDAHETLGSLAMLPELRWLYIMVNGEVDLEALTGIGNLPQLERLNWLYGRVEGQVIRSIADHDRLERLTLAYVEPGDGFSQSLESLTKLTHFTMVLADGMRVDDLTERLVRMTNLREWPTLRNVNAETLEQIVSAEQIESLTLAGVSKDVTSEHLAQLSKLKRLKRLDIQGIPVRDDWLATLSNLKHLEYLNLFDTGVTGSGFAAVDGLPNLREIQLFYQSLDGAWVQPALSSLKSLPALENVHIGGQFGPKDLEPLRDCKMLKQLRLWGGGFSDDSTAAWLSELPNLVELTLSDNCVVTDVGARALAQHPRLQKLSVGGKVTQAGANELARIPTLRQLRLFIDSSDVSQDDMLALRQVASGVPFLAIHPFSGSVTIGEDGLLRRIRPGESLAVQGDDGLLRQNSADGTLRSRMDILEGKPAPPLATASTDQNSGIEWSTLSGKVVLVDFWGTWCGPCRMLFPELQSLYSKYHAKGLEIVGVHTSEGAENLDEFVKTKNVPWNNIVDANDSITTAYKVEHYPSLFLVDRKGVLRVALAHHLGLEPAILALLEETN